MDEPRKPGKIHVRAVPWKTPTAEKVKGALGEAPAYVRRARRMEDAIDDAFATAARKCEELLAFVCLRLRRYLDAVPDPAAHPAEVARIRKQVAALATFRDVRPRPPDRRTSPPQLLARLHESAARFDRRWRAWIDEARPLDRANREIEGYNRWYQMERQAALRHVPPDAVRFRKRELLREEDLPAPLLR